MKIKKLLSVILAIVLTFGVCTVAFAEDGTRTENFFNELKKNRSVTFYLSEEIQEGNSLIIEKSSMRIIENDEGEEISELFSSAKIGFMKIKMYASEKGLFIYFPQFNRHMDFSFVYGEETKELIEEFISYGEEDFIPSPSYPEHMALKSEEMIEDEKYGRIYIETFSYDIEAVVYELVDEGIIPDPVRYNISLDDKEALSEFYWNYSGDYSGFASELLYEGESSFAYDENGILLAADYFCGEGRNIERAQIDSSAFDGIAPFAAEEDFAMPESSVNLYIFMMFVRLIFTLLVK